MPPRPCLCSRLVARVLLNMKTPDGLREMTDWLQKCTRGGGYCQKVYEKG